MRERDQSARINISMQCAGSFSNTEVYTPVLEGFLGVFCLVKFETVPACAMQTSVGGSAEPLGHF